MKSIFLKNKLMLPFLGIFTLATLASFVWKNDHQPFIEWCAFWQTDQPGAINQLPTMKFDYAIAWKEIAELEAKGLPKSALEKVVLLLETARSEGEHSHFIKALIHRGKYESQLEEEGFPKAIYKMQQEMEKAAFPIKPILQSMLAEMYTNYLDQNRWRFNDRTQTVAFKNEDIQTWTIDQLLSKSSQLYWASLEDQRSKTTDIQSFAMLLVNGQNDEGLRPTLFDFLAHRAIDHFINERNYLTQPAYKFEIADEAAFSDANDFVKWQINTKDTASQKYQALLLFQELLQFRIADSRAASASLLDADLKRLGFVLANSVNAEKDELYEAALNRLLEKSAGSSGLADVQLALAQHYFNMGSAYQLPPFGEKETDDRKWLWKKAHDLSQKIVQEFPTSVAASQARSLLSQILAKEMTLEAELVNLPDQPFLAKITYRNLPKAFIKIIRFSQTQREEFEKLQQDGDWQRRAVDYLKKAQAVKSWPVTLPDDGDLRPHSVEIKLDALPLGQYAILIAEKEDFSYENGAIGYLFTNASNIGYWERTGDASGTDFVVFDRTLGAPVKGATVEFWVQDYNSIIRRHEYKKVDTQITNADGFVKSESKDRRNRNYTIRVKNASDVLITDQHFYNSYYSTDQRPYQQTQFFLDRGIYRPGQTVYFKGVALHFDQNRMPSILKNEKVTVTLRDANYQEVAKLDLRSNEYGTFSGQFMAPQGGLLGNMQVVSSIGGQSKSFRVEEYKRPKFQTTFEPVTQSYRLGDTVRVMGKAMAYAGNQIDGAQVSWRVVRETRFPWYWWSWRMPWQGETMEIAHGTAITDGNGLFAIDFPAIPNKKIPATDKPEFSYTVYADVTDITGETQSGQTNVRVGYIAMTLDVPIAQQVMADSLRKLTLTTQNLNGEFEAAKGTVKVQLLQSPDRLFTERYWEPADRRAISEADFKNLFPQFAWDKEDKPENWPASRMVLEENFDTEKSKEVHFPKTKLQPGWYAISVSTKDKFGAAVELKKFVQVFDLQAKTLPSPALFWHFSENKTLEPGNNAVNYFGTSRRQQPVLLEYEKDGKIIQRKWLTVKEITTETFGILENYRGNVNAYFSYAGLNRSANLAHTISVPWSNKDLTIEYGTFRDKLQPGQAEEWVIKIKGPKGEKVAAEMVAGMYDASLDAFAPNSWAMGLFPMSWSRVRYGSGTHAVANHQMLQYFQQYPFDGESRWRSYNQLNWFDWYFGGYMAMAAMYDRSAGAGNVRSAKPLAKMAAPMEQDAIVEMADMESPRSSAPPMPPSAGESGVQTAAPVQGPEPVQIRSNLNETVFFFPHLMTDEEGNVLIKFNMNEALTKWKFLGLAHTTDLQTGTTSKEIVTQKDLMVVPNPPRFFRENDEIEFTAKVVNLTDKPLSGNAELQLLNPLDAVPVYKWLDNPQFNQNFTVGAGQSARLAWRFKVPDVADVPVIEHTVIAVAGEFSDGERSAAPVLSNRMLVTETKPLPVRGKETKEFVFESLKNNRSTTLRHQGLTLEFTQNPAWYAVQALPYLMEYPYECSEQIFSRYYANSLATSVANSHPKIKSVFDKWRDYQPDALLSNLSKNQELKTALLEETPWVLQAQSEEQQKKNIALLFDLNRMAYEQEATLKKLQERQMPGGGWAWFPGGLDSWYITQYIVEGFGHLLKLKVTDFQTKPAAWQMVQNAVAYCDNRMVEHYELLEKAVAQGKAKWEDDHLNHLTAHYLYTRSFFLENNTTQAGKGNIAGKPKQYLPLQGKASQVYAYYLGQAEKYWLNKGIYMEGMLALAMHRSDKAESARKVIRSLDERSLNHPELGKYWNFPAGYWWHQAPIESHALMIEAFNDIADNPKLVDDLKVWLLKNKQTTHWKTTKATANAVYALLATGDNWLLDDQPVQISFGKTGAAQTRAIADAQKQSEAGTGYFKHRFDGSQVDREMANVKITNPNNVVAWGALYWQYFEQLDKITMFEETPLQIKKQLFRVENTDRGEAIRPVNDGDRLKVGEKLKVRIELRVDRDMEYVHLKDMRASGLEPINVLSTYKWQGGLGYYESTRDAATNFFLSYLPKGTHVFEYPLRVQHNGDFSNGITTIQCMYAPEFTSHSKGIRVKVGE